MKKIFLLIALVPIFLQSFSQSQLQNNFSKDDYLTKSRKQKTTAWVLLGGGVALTVAGIAVQVRDINDDNIGLDDFFVRGTIIAIAGVVSSCISIPFFIGAAKSKRKAANVSMGNQPVLFQQQNSLVVKFQPALTFSIGL